MRFHERAAVWLVDVPEGPCRACGQPARLAVAETRAGPADGPWCTVRCWGAHADARATVTGTVGRSRPSPPPDWAKAAARWPAAGPPGISHKRTIRGTDILLAYTAEGTLAGLLQRRRNGQIAVLVDPDRRHYGIGKALVRAAGRRWPIDLSAQTTTLAGDALIAAALPPRKRP